MFTVMMLYQINGAARAKNSLGRGYDDKVFADLRRRYEMPNERNRWDCPMFRVDMTPLETKNTAVDAVNVDTISTEQKGGESQARVSSFRRKTSSGSSATTSTVLTLKKSTKNDSMGSSNPLVFNRLDERSSSSVSNACGSGHSRDELLPDIVIQSVVNYFDRAAGEPAVTPNSSTVKAPTGAADLLDELEVACSDVVSAIRTHQLSDGGVGMPLLLKRYDRSLNLSRIVSPAELARYQAQFIKMTSSKPPSDGIIGGAQLSLILWRIS